MFLDQDQQAGLLFNSNKPEEEEEEQQEEEQDDELEEVEEHLPLSLYYFPSPFEDDDVLLFQHHQHFNHETPVHDFPPALVMKEAADQNTALPNHDRRTAPTTTTTTTTPNIKMVDWDANKRMVGADQPQMIPRRRSCKRDRHSKINTARGPRDRRMRLSLEVARKFFGLQDILGFDKASKTVEWLLIQSDIEIKKLLKDHGPLISCKHLAMSRDKSPSPDSSESCEVVSGIEEAATTNIAAIHSTNYGGNDIDNNGVGKGRGGGHGSKASTRRQLSRDKAFQPRTKASREEARARARERTEKMNKNRHDQLSRMSTTTISWSPFETTGEESAGTQSQNNNNMNVTCAGRDPNSMEAMARCEVDQEEPRSGSQGGGGGNDQELVTNQDAFGIMGKWCPSPIFNSMQHQSTSTTSTGILQENHQFADFFGKPWEVYNSGTHNPF